MAASDISIRTNARGEFVANTQQASRQSLEAASLVCPFGSVANETAIAERLFATLPNHAALGRYGDLWAGYSHADRANGSSGGIVTFVLKRLLEQGEIDYALVIRPAQSATNRGLTYEFSVASTMEDVNQAATSFYHPVTYDKILQVVRDRPGRYAITGVPCFHKALRLLRTVDPVLNERIKYQIGIVCGQLKSTLYLEYLLRRAGVVGKVESACFRRKDPNIRADEYFFEAVSANDGKTHRVSNRAIGVNWGMGLFKPKACDACDDVFAETADIAVMDGWLPQYVQDGRGTSLVLVRDPELSKLLRLAKDDGAVHLETVSEEDLVTSQLSGIKHRHSGLAYRQSITRSWFPEKRIKPSRDFSILFKAEQRLRLLLSRFSGRAMVWQVNISPNGGLFLFNVLMQPLFILNKLLQRAKRKFK